MQRARTLLPPDPAGAPTPAIGRTHRGLDRHHQLVRLYRRAGIFWVDARVEGRRVRRSTGQVDREAATLRAAQLLCRRAPTPQPDAAQRPTTLPSILDARTQALATARPGTIRTVRGSHAALLRGLGPGIPTQPDLDAFVATERARGVSDWTLSRWSRELNAALRQGGLAPLRGPSPPDPVIDSLSRADYQRLLDAAQPTWIRRLLVVAAWTGARVGELLALQWAWLDGDVIRLPASVTKTGRGRELFIGRPEVAEALAAQWAEQGRGTAMVFARADGSAWSAGHVHRLVRETFERAGLGGYRRGVHTLRRSLCGWLVDAGVNLEDAAEVLGHRNLEVTRRHYASRLGARARARVLGL